MLNVYAAIPNRLRTGGMFMLRVADDLRQSLGTELFRRAGVNSRIITAGADR